MSDIKWLPDGQKTFDKVLAAVPAEMRDAIKPKLLQMLAEADALIRRQAVIIQAQREYIKQVSGHDVARDIELAELLKPGTEEQT